MILSTLCSMSTQDYCCRNLCLPRTSILPLELLMLTNNLETMIVDCCSRLYYQYCPWTRSIINCVQSRLDERTLTFLETKKMALFPTIRERRVLQSKIVKTEVYCYCRSPNDKKKEMVRCGQMTCKEWFYFEYIGTDSNIVPGQKWFCKNCK